MEHHIQNSSSPNAQRHRLELKDAHTRLQSILQQTAEKPNRHSWNMKDIQALYPAYTGTIQQFCPTIARHIAYLEHRHEVCAYYEEMDDYNDTIFARYDTQVLNSEALAPELTLADILQNPEYTSTQIKQWALSVAAWWSSLTTVAGKEKSISLQDVVTSFQEIFSVMNEIFELTNRHKCKPQIRTEGNATVNHIIDALIDLPMENATMQISSDYDSSELWYTDGVEHLQWLIDTHQKSCQFATYWNIRARDRSSEVDKSLGQLMQEYKQANLLKKISLRLNSKLVKQPSIKLNVRVILRNEVHQFSIDSERMTDYHILSLLNGLKLIHLHNTNAFGMEYDLLTSSEYLKQYIFSTL